MQSENLLEYIVCPQSIFEYTHSGRFLWLKGGAQYWGRDGICKDGPCSSAHISIIVICKDAPCSYAYICIIRDL